MSEVLVAFGRGVVKVLVAGLVGTGVGFLVFGGTALNRPSLWHSPDPPPELFLGAGAGLLTGGAVLLVLFGVPWLRRRCQPTELRREVPWEKEP
jgi:hypothetical protein